MDEYITRAEHEEFVRRMEAEDHRSSKRLDVVEDNVSQIRDIATSVEKLATNMEHMCKEQEQQGKRLEALEGVPAKNWCNLKYGIIGAIASAIGCGLVAAVVNYIR